VLGDERLGLDGDVAEVGAERVGEVRVGERITPGDPVRHPGSQGPVDRVGS
jgi:hypothetical protein